MFFLVVLGTLVLALSIIVTVGLPTVFAGGAPKYVLAPNTLSPPVVTIDNPKLLATGTSEVSVLFSVNSTTSGTFYVALANSSTSILSPGDMMMWATPPLPNGLGVSYDVKSNSAAINQHGWYFTVSGTNAFDVIATLSLSNIRPGTIPLQIAVFQVSNGGSSALGTINDVQLQVNQ